MSTASNRDPDGGPKGRFIAIFIFAQKALGLYAAYLTFTKGSTDTYKSRIHSLGDMGYSYLSAAAFALAAQALFIISQEFRSPLNFPRPDQQLLKVVDSWRKPTQTIGYAMLEEEGLAGQWNRSMRASLNFAEYLPFLLAFALAAGYVFPYPAFVASLVGAAARILYAFGYTAEPKLRFPGYILNVCSLAYLEGLTTLAGLKAVGYLA